MCELFAVSLKRKINLNSYLKEFYSHSNEHPCGWGMVNLDEAVPQIEKEAKKAIESDYLKTRLQEDISSANFLAHIRKATIGDIDISNNHPFVKTDKSGRTWIQIHNGTIFESKEVNRFQKVQEGTTDSERILLYIVDEMNQFIENHGALSEEERFYILNQAILKITPGNKVNLIIYDGENYYVHKNHEGSLFVKKCEEGSIFSTTPLDDEEWEAVPMNCLQMYREGELIREGTVHENTYIYIEEQYKYLYMAYASM